MNDWLNSTGEFGEGAFPQSCCIPAADGTVPECHINSTTTDTIYSEGCINAVTEFVREQLLIVAAIGIAFVVGEVSEGSVSVCVCDM